MGGGRGERICLAGAGRQRSRCVSCAFDECQYKFNTVVVQQQYDRSMIVSIVWIVSYIEWSKKNAILVRTSLEPVRVEAPQETPPQLLLFYAVGNY